MIVNNQPSRCETGFQAIGSFHGHVRETGPAGSMKLGAIRKQPAEQQATDALRRSIVTGAILPGARLKELPLADQFALSRGTVRAALLQLSLEGLVIQVPYTGWTVMPLSARDAWELYTLRASLEALAARLASERLDGEAEKTIEKAFDALVAACRAGRRRAVADLDFRLHKTIVAISGHRRLGEQYRLVEQQIRTYIASSDSLVLEYQVCIDHHRPIVDAILRRDGAEAARLSEEHNLSEGRKLVARLEAHEEERRA